jgi:anthranilate phosphoribosyltransferase
MSTVLKRHLGRVVAGHRLTEDEAGEAMGAIMDGEATPAQIGGLLAAMAVRGETEDEIVGFARAMRSRGLPLRSQGAVDTCGTGGDGSGTFNISTVASLVVAGCGVPVAKHGNRAVSGSCGSADVLEQLGVRIDAPLETVQRCLDDAGWAFLFAPAFHSSTRHAAVPRRELGVRTVFNLLGPLTNPALPEAQVVGVPRPELTELMARCLGRLGVRRAWVVHGAGLDELSPAAPSRVSECREGTVRTFTIEADAAGCAPCAVDDLRGGDAAHNAVIARDILGGQAGAPREAVVLNAAAALLVAGHAADLAEGAGRAREALDGGAAAAVLERVVRMTRA